MKIVSLFFAAVLMIGVLSACGAAKEEETTAAEETTTVAEETEAVTYTQQKVYTVTLPFGNVEATCKANADVSKIDITFFAFDEDQQLTGSVEGGVFTPSYDKSGFFGGDAQALFDGAATVAEWTPIQ